MSREITPYIILERKEDGEFVIGRFMPEHYFVYRDEVLGDEPREWVLSMAKNFRDNLNKKLNPKTTH